MREDVYEYSEAFTERMTYVCEVVDGQKHGGLIRLEVDEVDVASIYSREHSVSG